MIFHFAQRNLTGESPDIDDHQIGPRAVVMVEMAFVIPIMMITLIIAMDLSRFLIVTMSLNNALNQGVVAGTTFPLNSNSTVQWISAIENSLIDAMSHYPWFQATDLQVNIPLPTAENGLVDSQGFRSVEVSIDYRSEFLFPWPGLSPNYELHLTAQCDQIR